MFRQAITSCALAICVLLPAGTTLAQGEPQAPSARTISASGEATVYVVPDEIIVRVGVVKWAATLEEAKKANDDEARRLLADIQQAGVKASEIQTDAMKVQIDYSDGGPSRGVEGFIVTRDYAVTLKDVSKLESLIDTALSSGANVLSGVEYRTTKLREHRDKAREMAATAAREKAQAIAGTLGMSAGLPRQITETGSWYWGGYSGRDYGWATQNVMVRPSDGAGEPGETMPLGQIAIRAAVNVTFDLSPREDAPQR